MAETGSPTEAPEPVAPQVGARSADEVALELTKFIAVTTGYAKSSHSSAGFSGKSGNRSPEEQAESLLELFMRCRRAVRDQK